MHGARLGSIPPSCPYIAHALPSRPVLQVAPARASFHRWPRRARARSPCLQRYETSIDAGPFFVGRHVFAAPFSLPLPSALQAPPTYSADRRRMRPFFSEPYARARFTPARAPSPVTFRTPALLTACTSARAIALHSHAARECTVPRPPSEAQRASSLVYIYIHMCVSVSCCFAVVIVVFPAPLLERGEKGKGRMRSSSLVGSALNKKIECFCPVWAKGNLRGPPMTSGAAYLMPGDASPPPSRPPAIPGTEQPTPRRNG